MITPMIKLTEQQAEVVLAVLLKINRELERCYWNANQKQLHSPFENSGERYHNDTFDVRAYYWGDDEEEQQKPNFQYKDLECFWYKYATRGFVCYCDQEVTMDYLATMLEDCKYAIRKDFGEIRDED